MYCNIALNRVRATVVAVKKQYALHILCVCIFSLRYPACNVDAPYYTVICDMPRSKTCFHTIS